MNKSFFIALVFSIISLQGVFAQAILKGKITDANNGESMPGAQIYIPELQKGSVCDDKGQYELRNLPKGLFSIQVSFVGYATITQKIHIRNGIQKLDFRLHTKLISLDADVSITAIGYSSQHENAIKVERVALKDLKHQAAIGVMNQISLVPGIDIIAKGPGIATPVIRGLSQTNILILNNGVRMENYQFSENHPFMISNEGISKVEIIKGPASLLYGSDAIGGVINFVKERPAPVGKIQADINASYYSNTLGFGTNIGVKGSNSKFSWGIRANEQLHGDYLQAKGGRVPNTRFENRGISIFAGSKQKYGSFFIYYDYLNNALGIANPKINNANTYSLNQLFQSLDYHLISSKNKLFLGKIKLEINAAYQFNNRKLYGMDKYVVDMSLQAINYEVKTQIANTKKLSIITGLQGNYIQSKNANAPIEIIPNYYTNDFSLFVLAQYKIIKNLNLQGGARYDYRNIFIPKYNDLNSASTQSIERYYNHFSFTFGGTYAIGNHLLLRTNLASAFRSPNVAELTQNGMHGTRYEKGDINLKEQKSLEGDFGIHLHRNKWVIDASIFYNHLNKYIYLQHSTDTTATGSNIYQYTQNDANIYGFELGSEYAIWKYANLKAVYNYTIGQQQNGIYLPFIPQNKLRFEIKLHKAKLAFMHNAFISLGSTYAFAQDNPGQFETSSADYFVLNAGIGFDFYIGKQIFNIGLYGQNLSNTAYIDHLSTLKDLGYYDMGRNIAFRLRVPMNF